MTTSSFRTASIGTALALSLLMGCSSDDDDASVDADGSGDNSSMIEGVVSQTSVRTVAETIGELETAINGNDNIGIVASIDHQANAAGVDLALRPTSVLLFGNPALGSPLMQSAQSTAVDLPQKMLVHQDAEGMVSISYNDPAYLASRHGITGQDALLAQIRGALDNLANTAAGTAASEG